MLFRSVALVLFAAVTLAQESPEQQHADTPSGIEKRTLQQLSEQQHVISGLEKRFDPFSYVNVAYSDLHYTMLDSYNMLLVACRTGSRARVILAFIKVQTKVIVLAVRSRIAWRRNPGLAVKFVDPFFQSLKEFQILLKFVNNYPALVMSCRPYFNVIAKYLNTIISEMRASGVEFSGPTAAYSKSINYDFYRHIGIGLNL